MNLFDRIDQFEKLAQQANSASATIKSAAKSMMEMLSKYKGHEKDFASITSVLKMLANASDLVLNQSWDIQVVNLMKKINERAANPGSVELYNLYKELFDWAEALWQSIFKNQMGGGEASSYQQKPTFAVWSPSVAKPSGEPMATKAPFEPSAEALENIQKRNARRDRMMKLASLK
jgi:hypothetical protein